MNRRNVIQAAIVGLLSFFGIRKAEATATRQSFVWLWEALNYRFGPDVKFTGRATKDKYEPFVAIAMTPDHRYRIVVNHDYLGCTMQNRRPRPGEDWLRGNDLADGKCTRETWIKILNDINRIEGV